jgi:hypothetical protein
VDQDSQERRKAARVEVEGEAFWRQGQGEGGCRVVSLSTLGLEVVEVAARFSVGARLAITLSVAGESLTDVPVEVVRLTRQDGLALRFLSPDPELQRQLGELTEACAPRS